MSQVWANKFYHSKLWKNVRREVLRRDLYTCRDCYQRCTEVHHVVPLTPENINDYSISLNPDNLVSLCWSCHDKTTKGYTGDIANDLVFDDDGQVVERR